MVDHFPRRAGGNFAHYRGRSYFLEGKQYWIDFPETVVSDYEMIHQSVDQSNQSINVFIVHLFDYSIFGQSINETIFDQWIKQSSINDLAFNHTLDY